MKITIFLTNLVLTSLLSVQHGAIRIAATTSLQNWTVYRKIWHQIQTAKDRLRSGFVMSILIIATLINLSHLTQFHGQDWQIDKCSFSLTQYHVFIYKWNHLSFLCHFLHTNQLQYLRKLIKINTSVGSTRHADHLTLPRPSASYLKISNRSFN